MRTFACWYPERSRAERGIEKDGLGLGVACEMELNTLRQETLASTLTTTAQDGATAFGLHAGTEAKLAFARALGWLIGALHVVKVLRNRVGENALLRP